MAILATSRRWLVTSRCAASRSPCSRQLLASIYSSCGSSIGNRRISSRYRARPDSAVRTGKVAARAISALSTLKPPAWRATCRRSPSRRRILVATAKRIDRRRSIQEPLGQQKGPSRSSHRDAPVTSYQVLVLVKVLLRPHVRDRVQPLKERVHLVNERARPAVPSGTRGGIGPRTDVRSPIDRHGGPVCQDPQGLAGRRGPE